MEALQVLLRLHRVHDQVEVQDARHEQLEVDERLRERELRLHVVERQHRPQQERRDRQIDGRPARLRAHAQRHAQQPDDEHQQHEGQVGTAEDRALGVGQQEHEQVERGHHAESPGDTEHEQRHDDGDDSLVRFPVLQTQQHARERDQHGVEEPRERVFAPGLGLGRLGAVQKAHRASPWGRAVAGVTGFMEFPLLISGGRTA